MKREQFKLKRVQKVFESYEAAKQFSKKVNGYIEGPFLDDELNREYVVYYKVKEVI